MSVIFGIKENDRIIIAGDHRASDINGNFLSDNIHKLTVINDKLCIACAGNNAIEKAILLDIEKSEAYEQMNASDLLNLINNFYNKVIQNNCNVILNLPFCCLIAGQDDNNNACLICGNSFQGNFQYQNVSMILFHPQDSNLNQCNTIFVKNYKLNHSLFVENTISDISKISNLVSATGDKWIYNINTQKGELYSF